MNTRDEILTYIYKERLVQKYGHKQLEMNAEAIRDDLISEVYCNLCAVQEELLIKLEKQDEIKHKNLTAYVRQFIMNQLSPTGATRKLQIMKKKEYKSLEEWNLANPEDEE